MRTLGLILLIGTISKPACALIPIEQELNFELRNKATANILVDILSDATDYMEYRYSMSNNPNSERAIISFNLQLSLKLSSLLTKSPQTWEFAGCCITDNAHRNGTGIEVAGWIYNEDTATLAPGSTLDGFAFIVSTVTFPGIKKYFIESYTDRDTPDCQESCGSEEEDAAISKLTNFFNNSTSGFTLGPEPAPTVVDPAALIDRLISLKHQAVSLGWLRGDEFIKKLDKKLDQAKKALADGKPFKTRKKLEQFVKALEQQRKEQQKRQHEASEKGKEEREEHAREDKRFLNDNAFFLLKTNAEFIISKLPEKPKDKDEERESQDVENERDD